MTHFHPEKKPQPPPPDPGTSTGPSPEVCPRCHATDVPTLLAGTGPYSCKATCAHCGRFLRWVSLLAPSERMAHRVKARLAAMRGHPPSAAQLNFLQSLGFAGPAPTNMAEASALIDALVREKGGRS
jgi:hypothetical protein